MGPEIGRILPRTCYAPQQSTADEGAWALRGIREKPAVIGCRCAVEGLMNLPLIEDLWTVLAPLPLAMSIFPAGNDSGFLSARQRVRAS